MANNLGINQKVIFTGFRKDVGGLIFSMDIFVFPSIWEGFGLALIQAMACGRPVISTKTGIAPEIIVSGENGILVTAGNPDELSDAVIKLLSNGKSAEGMGEAAKKLVTERFSEKKMVEGYEKVYETMKGGCVDGNFGK
jgi:glycosyltransferase involved in cell wall biosynthesis